MILIKLLLPVIGVLFFAETMPIDIAPDYLKIISNVGVLGVLIILISKTLPSMVEAHRSAVLGLEKTIEDQTKTIAGLREELARQTEILRLIEREKRNDK